MRPPVTIDDPADPRIAEYVGLRDPELRRHVEAEAGIFVAEGQHAVARLIPSPYPVRSVLVTPARLDDLAPVLDGVDAPVYVATPAVMREVVGFDLHRGVVAAAERLPLPSAGRLLEGARTVAVLEALNDHENLGVLFRAAAGFGIDAVLLDPRCADPLYRRTVRVSQGYVLHVPWTRLAPWPEALDEVRRAGFTVVALTPASDAESVDGLDPVATGRAALLLGAEGPGLTAAALALADRRVRIPTVPGFDSLNVATAAAIAFHRFARRSRS